MTGSSFCLLLFLLKSSWQIFKQMGWSPALWARSINLPFVRFHTKIAIWSMGKEPGWIFFRQEMSLFERERETVDFGFTKMGRCMIELQCWPWWQLEGVQGGWYFLWNADDTGSWGKSSGFPPGSWEGLTRSCWPMSSRWWWSPSRSQSSWFCWPFCWLLLTSSS